MRTNLHNENRIATQVKEKYDADYEEFHEDSLTLSPTPSASIDSTAKCLGTLYLLANVLTVKL
jgi:hypothetical protein